MRKTLQNFIIALLFIIILVGKASHAESETSHYRVGPADVLDIFVWKDPELTRVTTVMHDGKIYYPLIGEVTAQGRTLTQLKEVITEKLTRYVDEPEVTVSVQQSLSRRIYMIGKVNSPGPYPLGAEMTVLQALSTAGGFLQFSDEKNILIIRREGGKEVQLRFDYKKYISGKNLEQNIILKPNDTIVVP